MRNIKRPSQFIDFDSIARPSPPFLSTFDTFPSILAQVDRDEPARVFEDDMRRYMTRARTINPEDRRVLVDSSVSPSFHVSLRLNLAHLDSRRSRLSSNSELLTTEWNPAKSVSPSPPRTRAKHLSSEPQAPHISRSHSTASTRPSSSTLRPSPLPHVLPGYPRSRTSPWNMGKTRRGSEYLVVRWRRY